MFLNNETDYAIRIVACLAQQKGRLDASSISEKTGVTQRFSLKILHRLTKGNIVKSFKGAKGGYTLAKSPEDITLLEIVELMCGPLNFSRCQGDEAACTHPMGVCYFRDTFNEVSDFMQQRFKVATFKTEE